MSLEDGQKLYKLKKKLSYTHKGETRDAQFLELREPGGSHRRGFLKLKQMVRSVIFSMGSRMSELEGLANKQPGPVSGGEAKGLHEVDQDDFEKEAEELAAMLGLAFGASEDVSLADFVDTFGEIACNSRFSSVCSVDGETAMTSSLWDQLHPDDAEGVALAYAGFFIMPSEFPSETT